MPSTSTWLPTRRSVGCCPPYLDGPSPPPAGAPNYFVQFDDQPDQLQLWEFHVDWANTANSTFTQRAVLPTAAFDSNMCGGSRNCIAQAGTSAKIDAIADRSDVPAAVPKLRHSRFARDESHRRYGLGSRRRALVRAPQSSHSACDLSAGDVRTHRYVEPLDGERGDGQGRQSGHRLQRLEQPDVPCDPLYRKAGDRSAKHAFNRRERSAARKRLADPHLRPVGRLQHARRGPDRRLHVLVHVGVRLRRRIERGMEHEYRIVQARELWRDGTATRSSGQPDSDGALVVEHQADLGGQFRRDPVQNSTVRGCPVPVFGSSHPSRQARRVRVGHPETADRILLEVEFDQDDRFLAHDPAVVSRFD